MHKRIRQKPNAHTPIEVNMLANVDFSSLLNHRHYTSAICCHYRSSLLRRTTTYNLFRQHHYVSHLSLPQKHVCLTRTITYSLIASSTMSATCRHYRSKPVKGDNYSPSVSQGALCQSSVATTEASKSAMDDNHLHTVSPAALCQPSIATTKANLPRRIITYNLFHQQYAVSHLALLQKQVC